MQPVLTANREAPSPSGGFIDFNSYKDNYVILTSDRLILNSKADSIFLTSKKTIGFSAIDQIHFNIGPLQNPDPKKNYMVINSPMIQLGLPENYKGIRNEPVAKAYSTIEYINLVVQAITKFCDSITSAKGTGVGVVSLVQIDASARILKNDLISYTKEYKNIKDSKIVSKTTNVI